MSVIHFAERQWLPDPMIRFGIRQLLQKRLKEEYFDEPDRQSERYREFMDELRQSPIAVATEAANQQHYEVPAAFYQHALGKQLKYSSCYWDKQTANLDEAEVAMLNLYLDRAELSNDQNILELGCGWGSLSLWIAERLPKSSITAVSNSNSQREYIEQQARQRGLDNLKIKTCDVNKLSLDRTFDRIVSIEMFEHMRNYDNLLGNISGWLKPGGKLFVHIFCHRYLAYPFETEGSDNWMGRYFFTGGLMPARDTLLHFQKRLQIEKQWDLSGQHYQKTAEAWLDNMDQHQTEIQAVFAESYGDQDAKLWVQRWRMFFMACSELFGYRNGSEWLVSHYRFIKPN